MNNQIPPKPKYNKCNAGHEMQLIENQRGKMIYDCQICIDRIAKIRMGDRTNYNETNNFRISTEDALKCPHIFAHPTKTANDRTLITLYIKGHISQEVDVYLYLDELKEMIQAIEKGEKYLNVDGSRVFYDSKNKTLTTKKVTQ